MRRSLVQLACVAALGGFAIAAQAQQYGSPAAPTPAKPVSPAVAESKTQADNEYRAALAKCSAYTETKRADCMREAEDRYVQSMAHGGAAAGGTGGAQSAVPKASR